MKKPWIQHDQYSWQLGDWFIDKNVVLGVARYVLWHIGKSKGVYQTLIAAKEKYEELQ
jgi:hypothetical protein